MGVKPRSEEDAEYIEQSWRDIVDRQQVKAGSQVNAGRLSPGSGMRP